MLIMPTSALMMENRGLVGTVTITTSNNGIESEEVFVFNEQGLLERHNHSRSGRRDEYQYDFDERNGFRLVSKTDNKGNITRYEASYDAKGLLTELSYSNGTKLSYSYRDGVLEKITHYDRGEDIKTDYYDNNLKLVRSIRKGVTIVYKYNAEGDVASMSKMKGNIVMESTTYEYEYGTDGLWTKMTQYNNGDYLLTKMRQFEKPVSIKHEYSTPHKNEVETKPSNKVYDVVETMPQFPNGDVALMEYIRNNMRYPTVAEANGIQGRVIVTLVVERDGSITDVEVTKSVDPSLDQEAVRIVKNMPKWKPGTQNGKTVRVKYTIPVTFRLM